MANPLRWGILGTGNIANQFAAGVLTARRSVLAAVGSRSPASGQSFADKYNIPTAVDYESLLAHPGVDAIYNSLPNSLHHQWTIKAIESGKHVLCEKPFAVDFEQSREMFAAARRRKLILVEAFMYRTHPLTKEILSVVRSGAIGEIRLIRSSFCYNSSRIAGNVRFDRPLAGGALMDVGCYCVNFSRLFAGSEPTKISATAHFHESGVDDRTAVLLHFPGDILATFTCAMTTHADNTAEICGSEGYIEIPIPWKPPAENASYVIARSVPPRMDLKNKPPEPAPREMRLVSAGMNLYGLEADEFASAVQDNIPPAISSEDTLNNMKVLDEIRRQIGLHF